MKVKRFLSLLLCLSIILTLLPTTSPPASAAGASSMMLGASGIIAGSHIYYGTYVPNVQTTPISWRVLSTTGNGGTYQDSTGQSYTDNPLFLLSEYRLTRYEFDSNNTNPPKYAGSTLQSCVTEIFGSRLSALEQSAVLTTQKIGVDNAEPGLADRLFILSQSEAVNSAYGLGEKTARVVYSESTAKADSWWLRSHGDKESAIAVNEAGDMCSSVKGSFLGVRPAFNLNNNSVLFASAAKNTEPCGKASDSEGADALTEVSTTMPSEWKLTLLDSSRSSFAVSTTAVTPDSVSIAYSGAKTGTNEYISAAIIDDPGYIIYYGRIKNATAANGSATINIPTGVTLGSNATLNVFNEQYNGDYKTDYASTLHAISTTNAYALNDALTNMTTNGFHSVTNDNVTNYSAVLSANTGYMLPPNISVTIHDAPATLLSSKADADTSGEFYYNSSTGELFIAKVNGPVVITAAGVAKTYTISVSPATLDFGSLTEGYTESPDMQTFDITNNGNSIVHLKSITGGADYTFSYVQNMTISPGAKISIGVWPTYDLAVGPHNDTLTIETNEGSTTTVSLSFTVQAKSSSGGGYSPSAPVTEIKNGGITSSTNLGQLISDGKTLTVDGDKGAKLVFSTAALKGIAGQTLSDIKVEIKDVSLTHQESLPGKQVFSLTVSSGSSTITNFGGAVTVTLPYTLKDGESADEVTVWYLASDGTMTEIPCAYDPVTKTVKFKVTHFSLYVVGMDTPWVNPFTDVRDSDWFCGAVKFVSSNGMMKGIGGTDFSPNTTVTRGMLVTILWRLEKEPATTKAISFADVSDSKWYAKAVTWAAANGITSGVGDNQFAPENSLTREQLAVMLYNYAKYKGVNVSVEENTNVLSYNDAKAISDYASTALRWACGLGIIKGDGSGNLNPQNSATRAEVAAMLERFIKCHVSD